MTSVLDDWLQPRPGGGAGGVSDRLSRLRPLADERRAGEDDTGHPDADRPDADHSGADHPDAGLLSSGPRPGSASA